MIEVLRHKILNDHIFYVLGIFSKENNTIYKLLLVHIIDDELTIKERFQSNSITIFEDNNLKKNHPVILHLEGDHVISKSANNVAGYQKNLVFGANPEDFYFYEYAQNETIFASVTRKSHIDDLLKKLSVSHVFVVDISFGPFVLANLLTMLKNDTSIALAYSNLQLDQSKIVSFSSNNDGIKDYKINDEDLNSMEVSLMGAFLGYKYPNPSIDNDTHFLDTNRSEFKYKQLFKLSGIIGLTLIILALFIGHILLRNYSVSLAEKSSEYALYQQTEQRVNNLRQERTLKERILQTSGINKQGYKIEYISDIGNSVPTSIRLTSIKVTPNLKRIRDGERIVYNLNSIIVNGETRNDSAFNEWLITLKTIEWIKKVDIEYKQDNKALNSFILKITI